MGDLSISKFGDHDCCELLSFCCTSTWMGIKIQPNIREKMVKSRQSSFSLGNIIGDWRACVGVTYSIARVSIIGNIY